MKGLGVHPAAGRMKMPTMPHIAKAAKPTAMPKAHKAAMPTTKAHFSAHNNVRLPQGIADVKGGDPGVYTPDIGKI